MIWITVERGLSGDDVKINGYETKTSVIETLNFYTNLGYAIVGHAMSDHGVTKYSWTLVPSNGFKQLL